MRWNTEIAYSDIIIKGYTNFDKVISVSADKSSPSIIEIRWWPNNKSVVQHFSALLHYYYTQTNTTVITIRHILFYYVESNGKLWVSGFTVILWYWDTWNGFHFSFKHCPIIYFTSDIYMSSTSEIWGIKSVGEKTLSLVHLCAFQEVVTERIHSTKVKLEKLLYFFFFPTSGMTVSW